MPGNVARALTLALTTALALAPTLPQSLTLCRPPAGVNRHKKRAGNSVFARDCQHQREVKNLLPADKDAALQIKNLPAGRALHQVQVSADHRGPRPWPSPSPVERGRPSPPVRAYTQVHLNKRRMSEWDDCSTRSKGEGAVSLPLRVPLAAAELLRLRADGSARLSLTAADERVRGLLPVRTDGVDHPVLLPVAEGVSLRVRGQSQSDEAPSITASEELDVRRSEDRHVRGRGTCSSTCGGE